MVMIGVTDVTGETVMTAVTDELAVATIDTVVAVEMDGCDSLDGCNI